MKRFSFFNISTNALALLFTVLIFSLSSCSKDADDDTTPDPDPNPNSEYSLGWDGSDDLGSIPSDINFGIGNGSLPSSVNLIEEFPPIGNQGAYGTCVAWAVGYNLKTALEGMDKNFSASDLANPSNQFSPKDLFWSVPNDLKGADCNGTNFEPALDVIQNRGIATLSTVPYDGLGDCSQQPASNWTQEAGNYKIANYRKIDLTVETLKSYLADGRPIAIGAKLGDNFMQWNSDDVISGHSSFNDVGQHAYHAMVIAGYDDNKGPAGAFKVINSWGQNWGDIGYIWVDYNFAISGDFLFGAFVATNQESQIDPDDPVDPTISGDVDLVPWNLNDYQTDYYDPKERQIEYNVYNVGDETAKAADDWNVSYLYYNAYDPDDYGILLYDLYTDEIGAPGENGPLDQGGYGIAGNWWNNVDLPSYSGLAEEIVGADHFTWPYSMPNITGFYYLVLMADAFGDLPEADEANNMMFITDDYGYPIYFQNGEGFGFQNPDAEDNLMAGKPSRGQQTTAPHQISKQSSNAYTPAEIKKLILHKKKTGELDTKVQEFLSHKKTSKNTLEDQ